MRHTFRRRAVTTLILIFAAVVSACSTDNPGRVAPLDERSALENLADAYRRVADTLVSSPRNQTPADKRRFVERVFAEAGYDYTATLSSVANAKLDPANQLQRDLVELLFFPTVGLNSEDMALIYSSEELSQIQAIKAVVHF